MGMATSTNTLDDPNRTKLPGFGRFVDDWGVDDEEGIAEKLSAVMNWQHPILTVRELCMLFFMNKITDKPEWYRKVHEKAIVAKWRQEANELNWSSVGIDNGDMSDQMWEHCIAELSYKAALYEKTGIVAVLDSTSCVLKSDTLISAELKEQLRKAVAPLENIPDQQKDWHPGSDGKVLDLIHPSLFPLVYTRSRVLPDSTIGLDDCISAIGKGDVIPDPLHAEEAKHVHNTLFSPHFQWLPCNVSFSDDENARIDSYINNLHPVDHKDLYGVIEKIITKSIPMWNVIYQSYQDGPLETTPRIKCDYVHYEMPESVEQWDAPDDWAGTQGEWYEHRKTLRVYDKPEPNASAELAIKAEDIEDKFAFLGEGEKKLQVIVKLANIHLTPEKSEYNGGTWHIEGQLNEHIVSAALYYYDNENITDSQLAFRTGIDADDFDIGYEQDDRHGINLIFGVQDDDPGVQELGSVLTREDRLIAFPNGFQHRVGSFKLVESTKPGHRKILALFLVAPRVPIISTANVPPQQRDWWLRELRSGDKDRVGNLPTELVDMIGDVVDDFPIGMEEAKSIRLKLMEERGRLDEMASDHVTDTSFCFCEH